MRILICGGTASARALASRLHGHHEVISSLAGRTSNAAMPDGQVRVGGFGGVSGLVDYLRTEQIDLLINATHPFAAQMSAHAADAAQITGIPLCRLTRTSWATHPHAHQWTWVDTHEEAAHAVQQIPGTVLLTIGALHSLDYVDALRGREVIARVATPIQAPEDWQVIVTKGPFDYDDEARLLTHGRAGEGVRVLVTKDSGGSMTAAKLDAAHDAGVQVVMISRGPAPAVGVEVTSVDEAVAWVEAQG